MGCEEVQGRESRFTLTRARREISTRLQVVAVEKSFGALGALEDVFELSFDEPRLSCARLLVVGKEGDKLLFRPCEPRSRGDRLLVREERGAVGTGRTRGFGDAECWVHRLDPVGDSDKGGALPWVILPALFHLQRRGEEQSVHVSKPAVTSLLLYCIHADIKNEGACHCPQVGLSLDECLLRPGTKPNVASRGDSCHPQGPHAPL